MTSINGTNISLAVIEPWRATKFGESGDRGSRRAISSFATRAMSPILLECGNVVILAGFMVSRLRVGMGKGSATAWGCDLSDQYVRINADYTT